MLMPHLKVAVVDCGKDGVAAEVIMDACKTSLPSLCVELESERVVTISPGVNVSEHNEVPILSNKFVALCDIAEGQSDLSSRPERIAAGGVAHLMEQLKPKDKGGKKKGKRSLGTKDGNVVSVSDAFLKEVLGYELSSSARDSLIVLVNQQEIKEVLFGASGVGVSSYV
ncbi:hypothetical protein V6N13_132264 [Hibiscus sabdariffa]